MALECCIVGIGKHASANLIPALQKLQSNDIIRIKYVCRKDITKGDGGLNVPVIDNFPEDVDFIVGCGHPSLHKSIIDFSNDTGIPCFVEKPHLINDQQVNAKVMIGYNFNFISILPSIGNFDTINCGTKGIYKSWPELFNGPLEKYEHVFHSVIVHPISVTVQKYGMVSEINMCDKSDNKDTNDVDIMIELRYDDGVVKYINYSTKHDGFIFDIVSNGVVTKCKPYKRDSYYNMLQYYVSSKFTPAINNANTGKYTLAIINMCLKMLKSGNTM